MATNSIYSSAANKLNASKLQGISQNAGSTGNGIAFNTVFANKWAEMDRADAALTAQKLKSSSVMSGDLNDDGKVNKADAALMKDYLMDESTAINKNAADFNTDGKVTIDDYAKLLNMVYHGNADGKSATSASSSAPIMGDLNKDGLVDEVDLELTSVHYMNEDTPDNMAAVDFNGDGKIGMDDYSTLRQMVYERTHPKKIATPVSQSLLSATYKTQTTPQASSGIKGDINNDGKVNIMDAVKLQSYLDGKTVASEIYNGDVDGNGTIDSSDVNSVMGIVKNGASPQTTSTGNELVAPVQPAPVEPAPAIVQNEPVREVIPAPQPEYDKSKAGMEGWVYGKRFLYTDSILTQKADVGYDEYVKDEVVAIMEESENAYHVEYWSNAINDYKHRWIAKDAVTNIVWPNTPANNSVVEEKPARVIPKNDGTLLKNPLITPISREQLANIAPKATYQEWSQNSARTVEAYGDETLSWKNKGSEKIFANEPVTVVGETENAYEVRYGVGTYPNYTDYKTRWVSKDIFVEPISRFSSDELSEPLQKLINQWKGTYWGTYEAQWPDGEISNAGSCFSFANYIFKQLQGVRAGRTIGSSHIMSNLSDGVWCKYTTENTSSQDLHNLFSNSAATGDFLQGTHPDKGQHSMIFKSYNPETYEITVFDSNWSTDHDNVVREHSMSLRDFVDRFPKLSVYTM